MSWFPLCKGLLEDNQDFKKLTPADKVYFWHVASEFNLHEQCQYHEADLIAGVTLNLSERKVRDSRRKLQALGFIETKPGHLAKRGGHMPTTYLNVKYAYPVKGESYVPMDRYTFETMLRALRDKTFSHADVAVYVYLTYLHGKYKDGEIEGFFVTKRELRELTSIPDAPERIKTLYDKFTFTGGAKLFEYKDKQQKLVFTDLWNTVKDPNDGRNKTEISGKVATIRKKRATAAGAIFPDDLPKLFRAAGEAQQRKVTLNQYNYEELIELGQRDGATKVAESIELFAKHPTSRTFSFHRFSAWYSDNRSAIK